MTRFVVFLAALAFILGLSFLTVRDVVNHSITLIDVVSFAIIAFFTVALLGVVLAPNPPEE